MPLVSRTRATLRSAEFGFFGVCVNTRTHTPRFCGLFCSAGLLVLLTIFARPDLTSWLIVGIAEQSLVGTPRAPRLTATSENVDSQASGPEAFTNAPGLEAREGLAPE